jgi:hypothetical protein
MIDAARGSIQGWSIGGWEPGNGTDQGGAWHRGTLGWVGRATRFGEIEKIIAGGW